MAAKASAKSASPGSLAFLKTSPPNYWRELGVFAEALREKKDIQSLAADARRLLMSLGRGNLRLLCGASKLAWEPDEHPAGLVQTLVQASDENTLIHLREFLRWKTDVIDEVFSTVFFTDAQKGFLGDLENWSDGRSEQLKPFTKLLLIYGAKRDKLLDAFFLQMWRMKSTGAEYASNTPFPKVIAERLDDVSNEIEGAVSSALSGRRVRLLGVHPLTDGTTVMALHQEFNPIIKRDFREGYNVHFGCGAVVVGITADRDSLVIKSGNKRVQDALKLYFERTFGVTLTSRQNDVFSAFESNAVTKALLGEYEPAHGVEIVEVDFRRSGSDSRPSLTLRCAAGHTSIRQDLRTLAAQKIAGLHSLHDLASAVVLFGGRSAKVTVEMSRGGAVVFRFDDKGWEEERRRDFEKNFQAAFGIPVNRYLDPFRLEHGAVGVAASLLSVRNPDDVLGYQQLMFEALLNDGILVPGAHQAVVCTNPLCRPKKPLPEAAQTCPKCDYSVEQGILRTIRRDDMAVADFVNRVFEGATSGMWKLGKPKKFEGAEYYPLTMKGQTNAEEVCVLLRDRLSEETRQKIARLGQPVLIVESHTDERHLNVATDGFGQLSLAYLYASQFTDESKTCADRCREFLRSLLFNNQENWSRAARISYDRLRQGTAGMPGNEYEQEIFNVLRGIVPYCYQIGREGKVEPDGFVCLPIYEGASMESFEIWNWTYDAKHSDRPKGYELPSGEWRKIVNYIEKFRLKLYFAGKDTKIRAHVIVSNRLFEQQLKNAAKNIFSSENGVKPNNRDVRLVLMREEYVRRLYELVRENRDEFQRRRPLFGTLLKTYLERNGPKNYTILEEKHAEELMNTLLTLERVEKVMTQEDILKGSSLPV